ncbi:hypothetical protein [Microseira wollei]|uniref:Uncharacterized protein n=1 Tax=Microseira wollei NIES-4236 TaxID=2530354 RepID=A0AAV3XJZ9_9CYAN|nr:hypothetical protein [Microseira wollei]GET42983.1 hypothetical protein MiSe_78030 [Microseira wollei NIES-4236]
MAGAIERIARDLSALEEAIAAIATELHNSYAGYLGALGQAVRHQLVLASYHLCTQGYPDEFLNLSFSQRQQLQQSLREIAAKAKERLLRQFHSPIPSEFASVTTQEHQGNNGGEEVSSVTKVPQKRQPEELVAWLESVEIAIAKTLQRTSRDSNRLLQQAEILPKKIPEPIIEAAAKVEAAAESVAGPPNLLNLVIEAEDDDELQSSTVTHVYAIHLRLSEIELADPTVMAYRHQIRNLVAKLRGIEREYQKKQRERAVAEAESAWRASWFDD